MKFKDPPRNAWEPLLPDGGLAIWSPGDPVEEVIFRDGNVATTLRKPTFEEFDEECDKHGLNSYWIKEQMIGRDGYILIIDVPVVKETQP